MMREWLVVVQFESVASRIRSQMECRYFFESSPLK